MHIHILKLILWSFINVKNVGHFRSFVNGGSTMLCFVWLDSKHVCGVGGTIAAITKVHTLCDVSCWLAMDWERLWGSFLWTGIRTLKKFHVSLGRSSLECYKLLKEGLGTMLLHMRLFTGWWMPLRMAAKRWTVPLVVEPWHWRQMNAIWNKWNVSCRAIATEVRICPASVYCLLTNCLGKWKVCAQGIPHMLNSDQRAIHVLAATKLQHWKSEDNVFLSDILTIDESWLHSFDP